MERKSQPMGCKLNSKKFRMGIGSPIISKHEKDSSKKISTGVTPILKGTGKSIKMKKI